jgi:hypothetical protein
VDGPGEAVSSYNFVSELCACAFPRRGSRFRVLLIPKEVLSFHIFLLGEGSSYVCLFRLTRYLRFLFLHTG